TKKYQNVREDILTSVKKIYAHGIEILAGFIIGFDNDTLKTFDLQFNFVMEAGIQAAMIGLLTAPPKTPLYERLEKEGRLIHTADHFDNTKLGTNIIPKQMSYDEMVKGYQALYFRLLEDKNIARRIRTKTRLLKSPKTVLSYSFAEVAQILKRLFFRGILPGGWSRVFHFFRSLPYTHPTKIQQVVQDWILSLSMRNYIDRHFQHIKGDERAESVVKGYLRQVELAFHRYLHSGNLEISFEGAKHTASNLLISLKGNLDKPFFKQTGRHLEEILQHSAASITLNIETLHEAHIKHLNRMLSRLSQYGDRIYISLNETLREKVKIDSSLFNLVLEY
ncbi:MAG: DUF4070 domain-containing protein, partial [Calditrichaeota bacterium]